MSAATNAATNAATSTTTGAGASAAGAAAAEAAVPLVFARLAVRRVLPLTPRMRRIVLAGPELAGLRVPRRALGPYVKLVLPREGGRLPRPGPTGGLVWPEGPRAHLRTYSVRRHDPRADEIWLDAILHGDGPGSCWCRGAEVGSPVAIWGPGAPLPPGGASAPDWFLLAGDHSALPALAYILENLPPVARGLALLEVPDAAEEQALAHPPGVAVTWLHRTPGAPSALPERLRVAEPPLGAQTLLYAGAEATVARAVRRLAARDLGLPRESVHVLNYWKSGTPEGAFDYCA